MDKTFASEPQDDGSFDDALLTMPDIETLEAEREDVRKPDPDGKKTEAEAEKKPETEKDTKDNAKTDAAEPEEEDDFIELPAEEEGKEPTKVKLNDVLEGWRKSADLEKQLAEAKSSAPIMPAEIEKHITALTAERQRYVKALDDWAARSQPQRPNDDLINPQSPNYNPDLYYEQRQRAIAQHNALIEAGQERKKLADQIKADQEAVRTSRVAREQAEVQKFWPEVLADEKTRVAAKAELNKHYRIDDELLDSDLTLDHRFYMLAKDALAYRAQQTKQAETVKAVKAKPRLIQGTARTTTPAAKQASSAKAADGFKSLQKSGSLDDAVAALSDFDF